jgi:hypothetical protein
MDFEMEIQNLKHRVKALENPTGFLMYEGPEAGLEVRLQRLAAYFTKRAKENTKRAEKLDYEVRNTFMCHGESEKKDNSAYYHSGKADTYLRAAGEGSGDHWSCRVFEGAVDRPRAMGG